MKKYLIIAVAALAASVACTEVNPDQTPDRKITFQAASYVPQTKANTSVWDEFSTFKCKAFLHAEGYTGETQDMFGANGETISPFQSNGSAATSEADVSYWAPQHDYYWPKSPNSYVNFIAWYDAKGTAPTTALENSLVWSNYSVLTTDNLLYADEAWHYKENTSNGTQYTGDAVTSGVPMLFHHALAQICIQAKAKKVTDGKSPAHTWDITLHDITLAGVYNTGTLTLSNTEPSGTTAATQEWTGSWAPSGSATTVTMSDVTTPLTTDFVNVLAMQNVLPQTVTNSVVLNFKYNISYKYNGTEYAHEKITAAVQLNNITNAISAWGMNKKITYQITIDPETTTIKIDPAVVEWEEVEGGSVEI